MAWISKGYIHTAYSDRVVECGRCMQQWVPLRALHQSRCKSFTCIACNLTAAPVYLPRPSERGYDAVVRECWEKYHSVTGRFMIHPEGIAECLACGHVWRCKDTRGRMMMCCGCHRNGVPQFTDEPAPCKPYGWSDYRIRHPRGGGYKQMPTHEVLCTRCDMWVPFSGGSRLVQCPGCDMLITVRLVGDKRIREISRRDSNI